MNKPLLMLTLLGLLPLAARADDAAARKNFARELADCSALYSQAAQDEGLGADQRQQLTEKSLTALHAASGVTNRKIAISEQQRALAAGGSDMSAGQCDQIMAHPNERFAYWRGR